MKLYSANIIILKFKPLGNEPNIVYVTYSILCINPTLWMQHELSQMLKLSNRDVTMQNVKSFLLDLVFFFLC